MSTPQVTWDDDSVKPPEKSPEVTWDEPHTDKTLSGTVDEQGKPFGMMHYLGQQFKPDWGTPGRVGSAALDFGKSIVKVPYTAAIEPAIQDFKTQMDKNATFGQKLKSAAINNPEVAPINKMLVQPAIGAIKNAISAPDIPSKIMHGVNAAVPIAGPMAEGVNQKAAEGNNAGALTEGALDISSLAAGAPKGSALRTLGAPMIRAGEMAGKAIKMPTAEGNPNTAFHQYLDPIADTSHDLPANTPIKVMKRLISEISGKDEALAQRIKEGKTTLGDADIVRGWANKLGNYESAKMPTGLAAGMRDLASNLRDSIYPTIEKAHGLEEGTLSGIKKMEGQVIRSAQGKTVIPKITKYLGGTGGAGLGGYLGGWPGGIAGYLGGKPIGEALGSLGERGINNLRTRAITADLPKPNPIQNVYAGPGKAITPQPAPKALPWAGRIEPTQAGGQAIRPAPLPAPRGEFPVQPAEASPAIGGNGKAISPDTVTVYQGEGAPGGGGSDTRFFSDKLGRAESYAGHGGRVKSVEIPRAVFEAGQKAAKKAGSGTGGDVMLDDEWARRAKPYTRSRK